ncbi:GxxExxY protein [Telmatospirillum sp.]|uniref:GxxExxY protein n=1 Tax=Telmatospirillum sp. TaxID=2079197 RepID=UPI00283D8C0A|nr:GxxExxY protein [Telmatospirillum sp.]MDR3441126.1 GxxExxY protein [Telmatospirillum sp.]
MLTTKGTKDTKPEEWPQCLEEFGQQVVDSAFKVHKELGPGLLESVYETCMLRELSKRGVSARRQVPVPIVYDGETLDAALKLDLLVGGEIIVEIKAVEKIIPLHQAQLLTYLRLSQKRLGFLINFNVKLIRDGVRRLVL